MARPFSTLLADLRAPLLRDPASRGPLDVILSYPGFHALLFYRVTHALNGLGIPLLPRWLAHVARFFTGIEIHPAAKIGRGVLIDHGMGVVIGETVEIGDDCTIYQGVTLGGTSLSHGKRHPTLGRGVIVGVNAAVLGAITIGDNARIGGGSVVVKDVPPGASVVGVPARVVAVDGKPVAAIQDRPQVDLPDPNAAVIAELQDRIARLERLVKQQAPLGKNTDEAGGAA
ncbi:MAG: serine O-acetyltransferase [Vulcanimicrobiaceae bacterium]